MFQENDFYKQCILVSRDNVRFHHCENIKITLHQSSMDVELSYLPLYSPDLNPIEKSKLNKKDVNLPLFDSEN